ncbi:unnamed protein product [Symbiodinium sp. CCMP2592]|nr:unnamed protein product [Symbiodinium sp. CCMP2592]
MKRAFGEETGKAPASDMQEAAGSAVRLHDETANALLQKLLCNAEFQQLAKHLLGAADGTEAAAPTDHADIELESNTSSGKNNVGAKNGTAPAMPGIQEEEGAEGSAGIRVYEESVDSLLQKLRNEQFQQIAKQLLHKKAMRLDNVLPRMAVEVFLQRYSNSERADHYFKHEQTRQGVIATLVTPSFFGSSFRGPAMYTQTQAEISACQLFVTDKYVLEAAEWLPPPMETIRKLVAFSKHQKQAVRERGYDTTVVQRDLLNCVYAGFRSLGPGFALAFAPNSVQ